MVGTILHFTLDDLALRRAQEDQLDRLKDKEPLLKSIGEEMLGRISDRFKEERDPDGNKWAPHAQATIRARLKKFGNSPLTILRARGHLAGSITYQTSSTRLAIGTGSSVSAYAGIHQFGGMAGRGRKVPIPARPYLGFGEEDLEIIGEEVELYLHQ